MEYTKSKYLVELPTRLTKLPREKPAPKAKALTKWEKFRIQKGMPPRKKRSGLVFDAVTQDFVPRWGPYSKKKIEEKSNWLMEEKEGAEKTGLDSFTEKKQKHKMVVAKEKLKQIKNTLWAAKDAERKFRKENPGAVVPPRDQKEDKQEDKADPLDLKKQSKKREQKSLAKSMKTAQLSTASMGKFDKQLKGEKKPETSQKKRLKDRVGGNELTKIH